MPKQLSNAQILVFLPMLPPTPRNLTATESSMSPISLETPTPSSSSNIETLPPTSEDTTRNLELAKHILSDNRALFVHVLTEEEADLRGLKWLLPLLTAEEQDLVKEGLGTRRINHLRSVSMEATGSQDIWLQGFVERLMLQKLMGGSLVERALGPDLIGTFTLADPQVMVASVQNVDTPAAWRILAEFIPSQKLSEFLHRFTNEQWNHLFSSAEVSIEDIKEAGERLKEVLKTQTLHSEAQETRADFFRNRLIGPTVDALVLLRGCDV